MTTPFVLAQPGIFERGCFGFIVPLVQDTRAGCLKTAYLPRALCCVSTFQLEIARAMGLLRVW